MKKNIVIFIILFSTIYSQSIADLERLANEELDKLRSELQAQTKTSIVESIKENSNQGPVSITSTAAALRFLLCHSQVRLVQVYLEKGATLGSLFLKLECQRRCIGKRSVYLS